MRREVTLHTIDIPKKLKKVTVELFLITWLMRMGMSFFNALKVMDFIRSTCRSFFSYAPGPDLAYNV